MTITSIDEGTFFTEVRRNLFGGTLTQSQVDGMEKILDYRDEVWPGVSDDELAYMLATTKWETAHTMQPISEYGSQAYLQSKPYYPWYGRGLVQLTWEDNYRKYGLTKPEQALEWPGALHVMYDGMTKGKFTGKKLADYIKPGVTPTKAVYEECRRIINGTDQKSAIADLALKFRDALVKARAAYVPPVPDERPVEGSPELTIPQQPAPTPETEAPESGGSMFTPEEFSAWMLWAMENDPAVQSAVEKIIANKLAG